MGADGDKGGCDVTFIMMYGSRMTIHINKELAVPSINSVGMRAEWLCRKQGGFRTSALNASQIEKYKRRIDFIRKMHHPNKVFIANELEQIVAEGKTIDLVYVEPEYIFKRIDAMLKSAERANVDLLAVPTDGLAYHSKVEWFDFLDCKVEWDVTSWLNGAFTIPNQVINAFSSLANQEFPNNSKILPVRCLNVHNINLKSTKQNDLQFVPTSTGRYAVIRFDKGSKSSNIYHTADQRDIGMEERNELAEVVKVRYAPNTKIQHVFFKRTSETEQKNSGIWAIQIMYLLLGGHKLKNLKSANFSQIISKIKNILEKQKIKDAADEGGVGHGGSSGDDGDDGDEGGHTTEAEDEDEVVTGTPPQMMPPYRQGEIFEINV